MEIVYLIFALPITVMVLNFGLTLFLRACAKSTFIKKDYEYTPTVSVLLPCFNEGPHVYETILSIMRSEYPMEKVEIVAVDDCSSDDSFQWLEKAQQDFPNAVRAFRNPVNSGKHKSLAFAASNSTGEVLICIDSDCIFDKMAIREMVACFSEPDIGAVGGRVGITNVRENIMTQCQTLVYYYAFHIMKMSQNWARNVTCISGCLFAIKREYFDKIEVEVTQRNWFGIGVRDGEDRYMTHLLLLKGLKTYINIDAQCWTSAPNNLRQLFMQQLRWRRSGLRDLFWTIKNFRQNVKVMSPVTIINYIFPGALTVCWPFMYIYAGMTAWTTTHLLAMLPVYVGIYFLIGLAFNMYVSYHNPEQKISPFTVSVLGAWFIVDSFFTTLLALCTFDVGNWGTRGNPK